MRSYKEFKARNAVEFFNKFFDGTYLEGNHVFRGQASSSWGLTPGVARTNYEFIKADIAIRGALTYLDIRKLEYYYARCFIQGCDESGINIPNDNEDLRSRFQLSDNSYEIPFVVPFQEGRELLDPPASWPDRKDYALIAMAQHHGLPTRLLDWSYSPFVAMYVASTEGMKELLYSNSTPNGNQEKRKLAVWVLDSKGINQDSSSRFKVIKTPPYASKNILSQESCFTTPLGTNGVKYTYELDRHENSNLFLTKMTMPIMDSLSLFKSCLEKRFTGANMYPGPEGAALHSKEIAMVRELEYRGFF